MVGNCESTSRGIILERDRSVTNLFIIEPSQLFLFLWDLSPIRILMDLLASFFDSLRYLPLYSISTFESISGVAASFGRFILRTTLISGRSRVDSNQFWDVLLSHRSNPLGLLSSLSLGDTCLDSQDRPTNVIGPRSPRTAPMSSAPCSDHLTRYSRRNSGWTLPIWRTFSASSPTLASRWSLEPLPTSQRFQPTSASSLIMDFDRAIWTVTLSTSSRPFSPATFLPSVIYPTSSTRRF